VDVNASDGFHGRGRCSGEKLSTQICQLAFRIRQSETAIPAVHAVNKFACFDERDAHAAQHPMDRLAIVLIKAAVDDCRVGAVPRDDQEHVVRESNWSDYLGTQLFD
jgi:hypothetical protein